MRTCPSCGNQYPDDANFCPMDATRLAPMAGGRIASPRTDSHAERSTAGGQATIMEQTKLVAGRFQCSGAGTVTPTGTVFPAIDRTTGSEVLLKLVPAEVLPNGPMADRTMRELKQLARVTSDRIVRVIDQGRAEGSQLYIALEKTGAISLEELVS